MEQSQQPEAEAKTTTIAEYNEHDAALAKLRDQYSRTYDVTKPPEMAEARLARAAIKGVRVALEAKRKEIKAPLLERAKAIDDEAKRIESALWAIEEPIDTAIKGEEKRREEAKAAKERAAADRAEKARAVCADIRAVLVDMVGASSGNIGAAIERVRTKVYAVEQEAGETHLEDVDAARDEVIGQLGKMYAAVLAQEEVQRKLAAERAQLEAEQKAENERRAAEQAKLDAERKRIEAEQLAARERIAAEERAAEKRRQEADAKAAAERARLDAEEKKKRDAEEKRIADERARLEAERKAAEDKARKEREAKEAEARAERELEEARAREEERKQFRRMDGFNQLRTFVERYGQEEEFKDVAAGIAQWLAAQDKAPEATPARAAKKGKVA